MGTGCGWTALWSCDATSPGKHGVAEPNPLVEFDLGYYCCCDAEPSAASECHDDNGFVDDNGHDCAVWAVDHNTDTYADCSLADSLHVMRADECLERPPPSGTIAENYFPCEAGGYGPLYDATKGYYYFPRVYMDEVRDRCPAACGMCGPQR